VEGLATKQIRLADITGRGKKADERSRRPWRQVADDLDADPSGASARIRAAQEKESSWFVTGRTGKLAADPKRRRDAEKGKPVRRDATRNRWSVEWGQEGSAVDAIARKLLADPQLAEAVYKKLHSSRVRA
jgi:hypothetical protein